MEYLGIDNLRKKLEIKRRRVLKRYKYYDMHQAVEFIRRDMPPEFEWMRSVLGWCAAGVDSVADRLIVKGFRDDTPNMGGIYDRNNPDILMDSAILGALIGSCSFIYLRTDENGYPRMRVIDGSDATGVIDTDTYMLREGYAVLERDANDNPVLEAYFIPGMTMFYQYDKDRNRMIAQAIPNVAKYPLLVPIIYRPDAKRPFGHSRITRACMDLTQAAMRCLMRSEVADEFFSYPQRYAIGLDSKAQQDFDTWRAAMSAFLRIDKDDDGEKPTLGQFQASSQTPYNDRLKMLAGMFAGETGLTVDDLGTPVDTPTSADAIRASHERLRLITSKAQRTFGTGFINAGYLAVSLRDGIGYDREMIQGVSVRYAPIFALDASQLGAVGDAVMKIQQAFPDYFNAERLQDLVGI